MPDMTNDEFIKYMREVVKKPEWEVDMFKDQVKAGSRVRWCARASFKSNNDVKEWIKKEREA